MVLPGLRHSDWGHACFHRRAKVTFARLCVSDLCVHLRPNAAGVFDVALHLGHGVRHIESTFTPLMHLDNVGGNKPVHVIIWLINHDMHHVKSALPVHSSAGEVMYCKI